MKLRRKMLIKHFEQSKAYCGPAALKILLSYFGKNLSEKKLAKLTFASRVYGAEHEGLIRGVKKLGGYVFAKERGTVDELAYFVEKEQLPVIIGWFDKDGDHYSVVVEVTKMHLITIDPAVKKPRRLIARKIFPTIWFDFVGKNNDRVSWGWYMVVTFQRRKFPVRGGRYY